MLMEVDNTTLSGNLLLRYKYVIAHNNTTTSNKYKLHQSSVKYDLRKHFFTKRVVSLWNSLPNIVVDSESINCFKSRLDLV